MGQTKKQHYITKRLLELFVSGNQIYEYRISAKKFYRTNVNNAMCERNIYEHIDLNPNTVENILANTADSRLPNVIKNVLCNLEKNNVMDVKETIYKNLPDFVICYFRSGAVLTELRTSLKKNIEDKKIEKFLSIVGNRQYIFNLSMTIMVGYKFTIIESSNDNFILSDQYISTCSLKPKSRFINASNRNIGLRDTAILIPITSKYYIFLYNGSNDLNLKDNMINKLSEEETNIINTAIYNNSYYKVAFKNENDIENINKDTDSIISPTTCIAMFKNNKSIATVTKKEVFLLQKYKDAYKLFESCQFIDELKTKRNDLCPCGSGKKFKHCCIEKYSIVKNMYNDIKLDNHKNYNISNFLTVERGIPLIENDYSDIIKLAKEKMTHK